jgi:crotonobetainyl-CoA:carnitine CoA-transferase CaiB-like acyl-CoA transferase
MSGETAERDLPLSGITVIDCGQVVAGPTIAMILGDFGAEVIKVENPDGGDQGRYFGRSKDGVPLNWKHLSRNKKTITLSLSKPAGQALFCRLIEATKADILVESFRAGTFERWNLGYERLRHHSPGLTMIRVSGFGQTGPYKDRPGFGTLAEAMSGFAQVTGEPDRPPPGNRTGSRTAGSAPRNVYRTKDDRWVAIAASTQSIAERLFKEMGREDVLKDPRFRTNRDRVPMSTRWTRSSAPGSPN